METCYIVGGGPSLKGFNWNNLDGKFVIAINRAYEVLPNAQICYFTDKTFWEDHKAALLAHPGKKIKGSLSNSLLKDPNVEEYILTGPTGLETRKGMLRHGSNSVYAAINLAAVHLKFRRIILLGVDMSWGTAGDKSTSHWHDGYGKRTDPEHVFKNKMLPCFDTLIGPLNALQVKVYNGNVDSKLMSFPKVALDWSKPDPVVSQKLLGDRVEQVINVFGGKKISETIERVTGKPCGCQRRKEYLNDLHRRLIR